VARAERDPQHFWLAVLGALRQTALGSATVQAVTPVPDLDGWAIAERLLKDLAPFDARQMERRLRSVGADSGAGKR